MKKITLFITTIALIFNLSYSQIPYSTYLDANQVNASYNVCNSLFWNFQQPKYEIPKGSGKHSIFMHSLWMGGYDATNQLHVAGNQYLQFGRDFYSGPLYTQGSLKGTCDSVLSAQYNHIWEVNSFEIQEFIYRYTHNLMTGYTIPNDIVTWPANGPANCASNLAPYFDYNNDGHYDPLNGDYPLIKGDKMLYWIINDNTKPHTESHGVPLGIEVHCTAYEYSCDSIINASSDVLNYTTFLSYKIINRSENNYHDVYVGLFTDGDLGDANDDYVGFNLEKNAYYFYNGDSFDGNGQPNSYGVNPPAQSVVLLQGPLMNADGVDNLSNWNDNNILRCDSGYRYNPVSGHKEYVGSGDIMNGNINGRNFGDAIVDNEKLGFTNFIYNNRTGASYQTDPQEALDYYLYMSGYWKDNTIMTYGGTGHLSSVTPARFMFPDNSDQCSYGTNGVSVPIWNETTAGNPKGDRRGMGSMGPINLIPNQVFDIDLAFVWSRASTGGNVLDKLFNDIDIVKNMINPNNPPACHYNINLNVSNINKVDFKLYPTLVNDLLNIDLNNKLENSYRFSIKTIQGVEVMNGELKNAHSALNVSQLKSGIYLINVYNSENSFTKKFVHE